jgi:hypothetical protein
MDESAADSYEIKRKIRKLKKLEIKIRFQGSEPRGPFVWDQFFDLHETSLGQSKYPLRELKAMSRERYKEVLEEFFSYVYYEFYKERGLLDREGVYDPELLSKLGLPPNAGEDEIKSRFRELAKKYHPDTGGDASKFIALMEQYRNLMR